ncbi:DUF348 domain-containing protein [Cytobacillus suaedae]|nr:DUF348 domain-containing protein [Cytobacillus suaedae]
MKKLFSESMNKKRFIISISSLLALGTAGTGYAVYEGTKETVNLSLNGEEQVIKTHANTVAELLEKYEIYVRSEDHLSHSQDAEITDNMELVWEASKPVQIVIGDQRSTVWTTADTVKELLEAQKITVNEHDKVEPGIDAEITKDITVTLEKAFQLTLDVGGTEQHVWATSTTVADFLENQQITLNELDRVEPALESTIAQDSVVKVVRIEKVTDVVEEPVAYAVITKNDSSIEKGKQKVVNAGSEGKIAKHFEVILENGKEVSRELVKTETLKESKDRVVAVGTKKIQRQVSRGTGTVVKEFHVSSTAYTAYCNGCSGTTATGINLRANPDMKVIAVDPSVIPLGTKVYVEGYGYAIAGDTGSAIKGNKIDVFFATKAEAYRWGRKSVKIKILD